MRDTIFYSWQSDLPNSTNRGLIEKALRQALSNLAKGGQMQISPAVDRDTFGVSGAPDIVDVIFKKIDTSVAVVCDVSIVTQDERRAAPNPNVLVELGYALGVIRADRVILVMNTAFGGPERLPFDLRQRRILTYESKPHDKSRAPARAHLVGGLEAALAAILERPTATRRVSLTFPDGSKSRTIAKHARRKGKSDRKDELVPRTMHVQPVLRNTGSEPATDIHVLMRFPEGIRVWREEHMKRYWMKYPDVGLEHAFDHLKPDQRTARERIAGIAHEVFGFGLFKTWTGEEMTPVPSLDSHGGYRR